MSLDTQNKRMNAANAINEIGLGLVPDGSIDADDRSNASFIYSMAMGMFFGSVSLIRFIELSKDDIIKMQARIISGSSAIETAPDSVRLRIKT